MGQRRARLILGLAACLWGGLAGAECRNDQVEIRTVSGVVQRFSVELADTPDTRASGLMFRKHMAKSAGMLFVFPEPKRAQFWMKNTYLPLDMLFVDAAGQVARVHANAAPMDESLIDGGPDVAFVLEINAGLAGAMDIAPGAVLRHPAIGAAAIWPCDAP